MPNSATKTRIKSIDIEDGAIVNIDVNNAANIAESKLAFSTSAGHRHTGTDSRLVEYANINNKSVVNADVSASAAIERSKIKTTDNLNMDTMSIIYLKDTTNAKISTVKQSDENLQIVCRKSVDLRMPNGGSLDLNCPDSTYTQLVLKRDSGTDFAALFGDQSCVWLRHTNGWIRIDAKNELYLITGTYIDVDKKRIKNQSIEDDILRDLYK